MMNCCLREDALLLERRCTEQMNCRSREDELQVEWSTLRQEQLPERYSWDQTWFFHPFEQKFLISSTWAICTFERGSTKKKCSLWVSETTIFWCHIFPVFRRDLERCFFKKKIRSRCSPLDMPLSNIENVQKLAKSPHPSESKFSKNWQFCTVQDSERCGDCKVKRHI